MRAWYRGTGRGSRRPSIVGAWGASKSTAVAVPMRVGPASAHGMGEEGGGGGPHSRQQRFGERLDAGGAPASLSLPMSPTNALRRARTMTVIDTNKPPSPSFNTDLESLATQESWQRRRWRDRVRRAYYGTLLSIIEHPRFNNRPLLVATNYVWPFLEVAIEFLQLSTFNTYLVPPGLYVPAEVTRVMLQALNVFTAQHTRRAPSFGLGGPYRVLPTLAIALVGAIVVSLLLLALQFSSRSRKEQQSSCLTLCLQRPLSAYVGFVVGALYIPLISILMLYVIRTATHLEKELAGPHATSTVLQACAALLCLLFLAPFTLFVSQNLGYIGDEHAFHLLKRRHNRFSLMVILVKTVGTLTLRSALPRNAAAIVSLSLFLPLLLAHLATNVFYNRYVNRTYAGICSCLVWGALCRILSVTRREFDGEHTYWVLLVPVFVLGWVLQVLSEQSVVLHYMRHSFNEQLVDRLSLLDLASNADVIYRNDLSHLLHSATRLGAYAQYLTQHDPDDPKVGTLFMRALKQEPHNAEILGAYADFLLTRGREEEAAAHYERAVQEDPDHLHNLEGYARFLCERGSGEALYYYQRSLLQYYEHYQYRDLYANSSEAMLILDHFGSTILDCNGATLQLFRARSRKQLCGQPLVLLELVAPASLPAFKQKLKDVSRGQHGGGLTGLSFEATLCNFQRTEVAVQVSLSRLKHDGRPVLQMTIRDMTALRRANERCAKLELRYRQLQTLHRLWGQAEHRDLSHHLFENAASAQLLATYPEALVERYSQAAEALLGWPRKDVVGSHLSTLLPQQTVTDFLASLPPGFAAAQSSRVQKTSNSATPRVSITLASPRNSVASPGSIWANAARAATAGGEQQKPQYEMTCDVALTTADGQDKTFIAHLSALSLGGNSEGKGARGFILVSMQEVTRYFAGYSADLPNPLADPSCSSSRKTSLTTSPRRSLSGHRNSRSSNFSSSHNSDSRLLATIPIAVQAPTSDATPAPFTDTAPPATPPPPAVAAHPRPAPSVDCALLSSVVHLLFEQTPLPLLWTSQRTALVERANASAARLLGYPGPCKLVGRHLFTDLTHKADRLKRHFHQQAGKAAARSSEDGLLGTEQVVLRRSDGAQLGPLAVEVMEARGAGEQGSSILLKLGGISSSLSGYPPMPSGPPLPPMVMTPSRHAAPAASSLLLAGDTPQPPQKPLPALQVPAPPPVLTPGIIASVIQQALEAYTATSSAAITTSAATPPPRPQLGVQEEEETAVPEPPLSVPLSPVFMGPLETPQHARRLSASSFVDDWTRPAAVPPLWRDMAPHAPPAQHMAPPPTVQHPSQGSGGEGAWPGEEQHTRSFYEEYPYPPEYGVEEPIAPPPENDYSYPPEYNVRPSHGTPSH